MIVVKLIGGLGNQMFQYAAGKCLAARHQTDLYLDTNHLNKDTNDTYTKRNLELNVFDIELKLASPEMIKQFNVETNNKLSRYFQRQYPFLFKNLYVAESGQLYQTTFKQFGQNTYLEGFWQSEKYFKDIEKQLLKDFRFKDQGNAENEKWRTKIKASESVALHIRRGDYISNEAALQHHGALATTYYLNALNFIKSKYHSIEIFIFSDDLDWCKANIVSEDIKHFVDCNQKENFHLDLLLMSECKHNVIANSSFSWWAAWLNNNENKVVIAPKKWFADTSINTKDIIPNSWIQI